MKRQCSLCIFTADPFLCGSFFFSALPVKTRPMTRAVPCLFIRIPHESASKMGTPDPASKDGTYKLFDRRPGVFSNRTDLPDRKSGRCKSIRIWIGPLTDLIPQNHGGCHGGSHPPLLKSRCYIPSRFRGSVRTDKRNLISCHTVLGRPGCLYTASREKVFCRPF